MWDEQLIGILTYAAHPFLRANRSRRPLSTAVKWHLTILPLAYKLTRSMFCLGSLVLTSSLLAVSHTLPTACLIQRHTVPLYHAGEGDGGGCAFLLFSCTLAWRSHLWPSSPTEGQSWHCEGIRIRYDTWHFINRACLGIVSEIRACYPTYLLVEFTLSFNRLVRLCFSYAPSVSQSKQQTPERQASGVAHGSPDFCDLLTAFCAFFRFYFEVQEL